MNAFLREWRGCALGLSLGLLTGICAHATGSTLYFIATLDSQGHVNQSWFSANNCYVPGCGGTWIPANRLPQSDDDVILTTSPVLCEANSISVNSMTLQGVAGVGGDFSLINPYTYSVAGSASPSFNGSIVEVQNEYELSVGPFGGTLSVSLGGGYAPALGDSFKIYTNGTPHGVFSSLQGAHVGNGVVLVPQYHSSDVTLIAANDPAIISPSHSGSTSSFSFQSTAGLTNVVEFSDSLNPQNWQFLTTVVGDGSVKVVTDNSATAPTRFYRVRFQ